MTIQKLFLMAILLEWFMVSLTTTPETHTSKARLGHLCLDVVSGHNVSHSPQSRRGHLIVAMPAQGEAGGQAQTGHR